jgi:signal transduction histidine kinase/CheY-like chemotaxis protein
MGGTNEADAAWRVELANKLSWAAIIALTAGMLVSYQSLEASGAIASLLWFAYVPALALFMLERLSGRNDYRIRGVLTVATLGVTGVVSTAVVGMIGGAVGALFLALVIASLLFGMRAMLATLAVAACGVSTVAWLMVTGRISAPLAADVSFAHAETWVRTAMNTLFLIGLGSLVTAHVVEQLERALGKARSEAAERERAQEERAKALELAVQSQKVEVVGRLAAALAHDLNNALFVIDACNQMLRRKAMSDAERSETHSAISDAVKQSSAMARQPLSFARKHAINARDAMSSGGELTVRFAPAALAAPRAAIGCEIPPGHYATFEVRDTGTGMDEATAARAFEPLFTTKPEGKGTGLGLASVQSIVEISGGYLTLWSEPGEGTSITLYLPCVASLPRAARAPMEKQRALDLRGTTVLLAEDSADVHGVISSVLAQHGCAVLQARDGTDALRQIERAPSIDVLCTDAVMPGAPVREVIALLQRMHPRASVVVISGYVTDELTRRGIEQGHFRVLAKPFEPSRLLETIDELRRAPAPHQGTLQPMA